MNSVYTSEIENLIAYRWMYVIASGIAALIWLLLFLWYKIKGNTKTDGGAEVLLIVLEGLIAIFVGSIIIDSMELKKVEQQLKDEQQTYLSLTLKQEEKRAEQQLRDEQQKLLLQAFEEGYAVFVNGQETTIDKLGSDEVTVIKKYGIDAFEINDAKKEIYVIT